MLQQPSSCNGCPLHGLSTGFMAPSLATKEPYGVALVGEALGADEAEAGSPFVGKAGFRLTRLIEWAGLDRARFDIFNTAWCRPPDNKLDGEWYERGAISHCRSHHWDSLLSRNRVVIPMGNLPQRELLGIRGGILTTRGYIYTAENAGYYVIPTVHPSFIQRGQSRWSAPFISDLQKAVSLAAAGMPPVVYDYRLDPSPLEALHWAEGYRRALRTDPTLYLAFDIETPGKDEDEDELEVDLDAPDKTWTIERIGFSYRPYSALSIPWDPIYFAAIRILLESSGQKVVWNTGFDVPRVRRQGFAINGTIHDGMIAWHVLHSDLPKRLGFVATFTCPWQPAWKHLSSQRPAFYNATDADVELSSMLVIERELRRAGLWEVYQRDVVELEPILVHMHQKGMPIDAVVREKHAIELAERQRVVDEEMEKLIPDGARRIDHVFARRPKETEGLLCREADGEVRRCSVCGLLNPTKPHFKRYVKKVNPCADAVVRTRVERVEQYYRVAPWSPSRDHLIRYHAVVRRPCPMVWDKKAGKRKISFGEKQLKELMVKHQDDPLYGLILQHRRLDKVAGTYIGRPSGE